jgi:glutathione peroxidase-family protein
MKTTFLMMLFALLWAGSPVKEGYEIGDTAADFKLKNVDGKMVSLADFKNAKGFIVVFDCNTCPYSKAYNERIVALNRKYASLGFPVIAINPNDPAQSGGDSFDEMVKVAKKKGYDQIIWTDGRSHEHVEESGTTNLFFIINDDTVWTPALDGNILRGVTRDSCIKLLKQRGLKIEERKITVSEVIEAAKSGAMTDCFGTGTAAIIAKIAGIGYKGNDYMLPNAENRVISNWIYKTIYGIQTGNHQDDFNWIVNLK